MVFVVEGKSLSCVEVAFSDFSPEANADVVLVNWDFAAVVQVVVVAEDFVNVRCVEFGFEFLDEDVLMDFGFHFRVVGADDDGYVVMVVVVVAPPARGDF